MQLKNVDRTLKEVAKVYKQIMATLYHTYYCSVKV